MSEVQHDRSGDVTFESIMEALATCYGSLAEPNFRKIYIKMKSPIHQQVIEELRARGVEIVDTTDENDDVSNQIVAMLPDDRVSLGLSGIGPFATVVHQAADGQSSWVTQPDKAPTPLAILVAATVKQAGFQLLDRNTVTRTIKMNRADGTTEATLYQALFTDTDRIP